MRDDYDVPLYLFVGDMIRLTREQTGISQQALADRIGLSRVSVVNIERGRQRPPLHILWAIAGALDTELRDLLPLHANLSTELDALGSPIADAIKELHPKDAKIVSAYFKRIRKT